jgi:hypothetical protein
MDALTPALLSPTAHRRLEPLRSRSASCDRTVVGETMGSSSFLGLRKWVCRVLRRRLLPLGLFLRHRLLRLQHSVAPLTTFANDCGLGSIG